MVGEKYPIIGKLVKTLPTGQYWKLESELTSVNNFVMVTYHEVGHIFRHDYIILTEEDYDKLHKGEIIPIKLTKPSLTDVTSIMIVDEGELVTNIFKGRIIEKQYTAYDSATNTSTSYQSFTIKKIVVENSYYIFKGRQSNEEFRIGVQDIKMLINEGKIHYKDEKSSWCYRVFKNFNLNEEGHE